MSDQDTTRADVQKFARYAGIGVIVLAAGAYALAALIWSQGQAASALVLAIFGYLLLRSRRTIAHSLTMRRFVRRSEYADALIALEQDKEQQSRPDVSLREQDNERKPT